MVEPSAPNGKEERVSRGLSHRQLLALFLELCPGLRPNSFFGALFSIPAFSGYSEIACSPSGAHLHYISSRTHHCDWGIRSGSG